MPICSMPVPQLVALLVYGGHREFLDVQAFSQDQWNAAIALHAAVLGDPGGAEVLLLIQRHLRRRLDGHFRLAAFAEELAGVIVALNRNADAVPRTPLNHGHRTDAVEPEARNVDHVILVGREIPLLVVEGVLPLGPPLENNPEIPPSSRDEGLRLLHGLET